MFSAYVLCCRAHGRLDRLPRCVHEQFAEPFEDLLDLLRVGFVEILQREWNADFSDTSSDLMVRLERFVRCCDRWALSRGAYKAHERVAIVLLLLATIAIVGTGLRSELMTHSRVEVHNEATRGANVQAEATHEEKVGARKSVFRVVNKQGASPMESSYRLLIPSPAWHPWHCS